MDEITANKSREVAEFYERQITACNTFEQLSILKDQALEDGRLTSVNRAYVAGCAKSMEVILNRVSGIREFASQIKDNTKLIDVILLEAVKKFECR